MLSDAFIRTPGHANSRPAQTRAVILGNPKGIIRGPSRSRLSAFAFAPRSDRHRVRVGLPLPLVLGLLARAYQAYDAPDIVPAEAQS